jgi:predicted TIM-barrel fold metal-dependent hydrolase
MGPPEKFPFSDRRPYSPPTASIETYLAAAAVLGLERGVAVQSSTHGYDPAALLDAIRKSDGRLCGMIRADPDLEPADLRALHAQGVRGIRLELRKLDGSFDRRTFDRLVGLAADQMWVIALHVDPDTVVRFADDIRRIPAQTVLENFALVDARLGPDQPAIRSLIDLAAEKHIWLKTASSYRMGFKGASADQIRAVARAVHAGSPDRSIWGTDWPHPGRVDPAEVPDDANLVDSLLDFVPDEDARHRLLVDNPRRLFG